LSTAYRGPLALMSFDPAVMTAIRELAPGVPRGIVSGLYDGNGWWRDKLDDRRAYALSHFLESRPVAPDFYAYDVKALPTPVTRFVREVLGLPLFTWTVRTPEQRKIAERWADAPIFEGYEP
jgi:glycerophosphoryl diester phosphodiesterase